MVACTETAAPPQRLVPIIEAAEVASNPQNALSARMLITARHADSVAVRFRVSDDAESIDVETPAVVTAMGTAAVPVLGMFSSRRYIMRAVAFGRDGKAVGEPLEFTTGALPADLPAYVASGDSPSPGYVVFAAGMYGLVIDNTGRVVWYRRFQNGPWLNFMPQANDRYVARRVTTDPADIEPWVEVDPLGNEVRTFGCALGLQARFHDLISEPDGGYWVLCDEVRTLDLRAYGGVAAARVTGQAVQHLSADGELLFHWSPFDHFAITDVDSATRSGTGVNWTHGNSLDLDADGNLLVSFRNLNEITKISSQSGAVLWRLGGLRNEFTFTNGAAAFSGQHSVRTIGPNRILLLDNVGDPLESRAERWEIDPGTRTASVAGAYAAVPRVRTLIGGSVQALPENRTLVSFGTEGRVEEYDASGNVVWRIEGTPGYVFRAQRIRSLYRPGLGLTR
jgi:hypothetical protein